MIQKQAHELGVNSGLDASECGKFTPAEPQDEEGFFILVLRSVRISVNMRGTPATGSAMRIIPKPCGTVLKKGRRLG